MLSTEQKKSLETATTCYWADLCAPGSPGGEFLGGRGLPADSISPWRIGYVSTPLPGHEQYKGMLAIPYLRRSATGAWSVITMRFRRIHPGAGTKYLSLPGHSPDLFNTLPLATGTDRVVLCEGELDTITANLCGLPAVGVPGARSWDPEWAHTLDGVSDVWIFADGDPAGKELSKRIVADVPHAKIINFPPKKDVNDIFCEHGAEGIHNLMKGHI